MSFPACFLRGLGLVDNGFLGLVRFPARFVQGLAMHRDFRFNGFPKHILASFLGLWPRVSKFPRTVFARAWVCFSGLGEFPNTFSQGFWVCSRWFFRILGLMSFPARILQGLGFVMRRDFRFNGFPQHILARFLGLRLTVS